MEVKRFVVFILLAFVAAACAPDAIANYNATMTVAHSGTGGQYVASTPTPLPGMALISAEMSVTQAAINAQAAQTVADQTRAAYAYTAAQATLQAQQALATQIAPTQFAKMTQDSQYATAVYGAAATSNSLTATIQSAQIAQVLAMGTAENIVSVAAAQGTATAIAKLAAIEEQARLAQQEELAIANRRAAAKATLSWVAPAMVLVILFTFSMAFSYRMVVQARPQVIDDRKSVITYDHTGMPMLSRPPRYAMLSAPADVADKEEDTPPVPHGEVVELPDLMPGVLQIGVYEGNRPVHLGPGFMGIQLTGQKGSGKSSLLRLMAAQALSHGWDVFYADAEALTFDPALWGPVAQTTADARLLFAWLRDNIFAERHNLFREAFSFVQDNLRPQDQFLVDNLTSYNKAAKLFNMPILKPMLMVWDEANSHLRDKPLQEMVEKAFQASRKVGCDSVVAGHNWRATDIPAGLKLQLPNAVIMRCSEQDSKLTLGDPSLAANIPADTPGAAYVRLKRWQGYMQSYYIPDHRLIQMVRDSRPQLPTLDSKPWIVTRPTTPALSNEMDLDELFRLADGGSSNEVRPRKLDPNDPRLRQRVIELYQTEKEDGSRYSQREIEGIVTGEFCAEAYQGGQAYKVVKEIISGGMVAAA
jgi:hypothetical protein